MPRYRIERIIVIAREEVAPDEQGAQGKAKQRDLPLGPGWRLVQQLEEKVIELSLEECVGIAKNLLEPEVSASCHSEDHAVEVKTFNATPHIARLYLSEDDDGLLTLLDERYAADEGREAIVETAEEYDSRVADMLAYTRISRQGFTCEIDEDQFKAWLAEHRPDLLQKWNQEE